MCFQLASSSLISIVMCLVVFLDWSSVTCQNLSKPFFVCMCSGKLVGALLSGVSDRSAGVRKAYAGATGHLVKVRQTMHSLSTMCIRTAGYCMCVYVASHNCYSACI